MSLIKGVVGFLVLLLVVAALYVGGAWLRLYGEHEGAVFAESFGDAFVALPFSVFVAPDGQVVAQKSGELQPEELRRLIVQLDGTTQE